MRHQPLHRKGMVGSREAHPTLHMPGYLARKKAALRLPFSFKMNVFPADQRSPSVSWPSLLPA